MIYAVIDTNVIVSAILASRKDAVTSPWKVMDYIFSGHVTPVFSDDILQEYEDVLNRPKFHFNKDVVRTMIGELERLGINGERIETDETFPDLDDAVFFEVAMASRQSNPDSYVVTGNIRHFPVSPIVMTPAQFVAFMETRAIR